MLYTNVLSEEQKTLLHFIQSFENEYYLVGGTAIALQVGHRESIDFDMFKLGNVSKNKIIKRIEAFGLTYKLIYANAESFHIMIDGVKITFFQFPFKVPVKKTSLGIKMPSLLDLAAMKAYALGRRAKWKDYFDLYVILKDFHDLESIIKAAEPIFKQLFSAKLFRQQLCYFKDIDHTEEITLIAENSDTEEDVKAFLTSIATKHI